MTYIKKSHQVVLHDAAGIIEKRKKTLNKTEKVQYEAFCDFLDEIDSENRTISDRNAERMREFRSTPEGKERNREIQRKAMKRYYDKKKAQKQEQQ